MLGASYFEPRAHRSAFLIAGMGFLQQPSHVRSPILLGASRYRFAPLGCQVSWSWNAIPLSVSALIFPPIAQSLNVWVHVIVSLSRLSDRTLTFQQMVSLFTLVVTSWTQTRW